MYTENDLGLLTRIHDLLYNKKFTIAGARKQLQLGLDDEVEKPAAEDVLSEVKQELKEILSLLNTSGRGAAR